MPSYQDRIRLDRYAIKDANAILMVGDVVIATVKRKSEQDGEVIYARELGQIKAKSEKTGQTILTVALIDEKIEDKDWEIVELPAHDMEKLVETAYSDICKRVADATIENEPENLKFRDDVQESLEKEYFVPAGRILSGLGRKNKDLTVFNCYVLRIKEDSRKGISEHWYRIFDTFSRGGGVGWDLSILRPRGSVVEKVSGRSSGAVTWAEQFSQITGTVEQGGSRRGASMQTLWCWHPDIEEFIEAKSERIEFEANGKKISRSKELLCNSNVSVLISDDFMTAVTNDQMWELVFPDTKDPDYDEQWNGNIDYWKSLGKDVIVYKRISAVELWNKIIEHAWQSGEPGILFLDRANKLANSYYYTLLVSSNPCAEQLLPANGVCNLGHLYLAKFIKDGVEHYPEKERTALEALELVDFDRMAKTIQIGIRFLDNIIDLNKYHDVEIKEQQEKERRIGLGVLGFGELLIRLGLRYGSRESETFTRKLFKNISEQSYIASSLLAAERGSFPLFDAEKLLASGFLANHTDKTKAAIMENGLRNVTVNTVAPTGSVGTMLNTSTGIEPYFLAEWVSRTRIGLTKEHANVLVDLKAKFGNNLPSYFVTAEAIKPLEHIRIQAAVQKWIDSSVSKTINLPQNATAEDVKDAYTLMYSKGCKGGTVYRYGSRDRQVLYATESKNEPPTQADEYKIDTGNGTLRPKIKVGIGPIISEDTPVGTVHTSIRLHPVTGEPFDVFITSGKGDVAADAQAMSRLISIILRWPNGESISQSNRLEIIRDQLRRIPGRGQVGFGPDSVISLPDGIAKTLQAYLKGEFPRSSLPLGTKEAEKIIEAQTSDDIRKLLATLLLENDFSSEMYTEFDEDDSYLVHVVDDQSPADFQNLKTNSGSNVDREICPECKNATVIERPGKCSHCEYCGHSYC